MQEFAQRTFNRHNACCRSSFTAPRTGLISTKERAGVLVVAASTPSRSGKGKASAPSSKKPRSNAKVKQAAKASPQSPKLKQLSSAGRPAARPAAAPTRASVSPHLPRPSPAPPSKPVLRIGAESKSTGGSAVLLQAVAVAKAAGDLCGTTSGSTPQGGADSTAPSGTPSAPVFAGLTPAGTDPDQESDTVDDGFLLDERNCGAEEGQSGPGDEGLEEDEEDEEAFPEIQLNLPKPSNVKVKTADYLKSCVSVADCPPPRFPEFAVIGRSNVGKSSLINMLTGRNDLALVSKQPGKTKCINHFLINDSWYFVDLPGYGFAKVGLQSRQQFDAFTREYFKTRPNLAMVFMLVDASIPPQKIDLEYANWLTDNQVPFALVFTKFDKRRKGVSRMARESHVTAFKRALLRDLAFLPPSIMTSAAKGLGRSEMLNFIAGLRIAFERSGRLAAIKQGML